MKRILQMLFTSIGGMLGSLYGYMTVLATIPALIASDIPVPASFVDRYRSSYFYVVLPLALVVGWWVGKWRLVQIEALDGWRNWAAMTLLGLIMAVLGYVASLVLFLISSSGV